MALPKVPAENQPLFFAALPKDPRVETVQMFGGVAAKVNGRVFAGLFGRSTMVLLSEAERAAALKLEGAAFFDPMGNGRVRSEKVMLPESVMRDPAALRRWLTRAFDAAARLPPKTATVTKKKPVAKTKPVAKKKSVAKKARPAR
ncbi:MAG: TfoX/Sxy family protein [Myxococcales bacterium]|jgi:TfoX/Sxy family transcriptional regulator of competence genes